MLIKLNGVIEEVPENATVRDIMTGKKLPEELAVVALNDEVVRRDTWQSVRLKADDRMEVIRVIGGG
jgi:thiamine biosynthesis protein ThiS